MISDLQQMKKQHYIIITPFFPTEENFRGPFIYDQAKAIAKESGYEVSVLKLVHKGDTEKYSYQGIEVYPVKIKDLPSFVLPGLFMKKNRNKILQKLKEITNENLKTIKFIHGHVTYSSGILAVAVAEKLGAKSIVQHHGLDVMGYTNGCFQNEMLKKLNRKWINKVHVPYLNKASLNVGVSQKTLDKLNAVPGYARTPEFVLYNGVDSQKFYKNSESKDSAFFTVGCIGNFWKTKDQITLIKAFHKFVSLPEISNAQLKLIGTGTELQSCKDYVNQNNLQKNIYFLDAVDHTALGSFYNSLDLFVLPSYDEAFGCVYTEAYACGVPFIGVQGQGIDEMILAINKSKQLVSKGDFNQLSELLLDYYKGVTIDNLAYEWKIEPLIKEYLKVLQPAKINNQL